MSDPQAEKIITDGLPEGWTFHTVQHGDYVTYEVRNDQRFLIMSSTWNRSWSTKNRPADG
jgi:hypothetical protein